MKTPPGIRKVRSLWKMVRCHVTIRAMSLFGKVLFTVESGGFNVIKLYVEKMTPYFQTRVSILVR